jgi:hypothetical protein
MVSKHHPDRFYLLYTERDLGIVPATSAMEERSLLAAVSNMLADRYCGGFCTSLKCPK